MNHKRNFAILALGILLLWLASEYIQSAQAQPAIIKQIDIIAGEDPFNREYLQYLEMVNE